MYSDSKSDTKTSTLKIRRIKHRDMPKDAPLKTSVFNVESQKRREINNPYDVLISVPSRDGTRVVNVGKEANNRPARNVRDNVARMLDLEVGASVSHDELLGTNNNRLGGAINGRKKIEGFRVLQSQKRREINNPYDVLISVPGRDGARVVNVGKEANNRPARNVRDNVARMLDLEVGASASANKYGVNNGRWRSLVDGNKRTKGDVGRGA